MATSSSAGELPNLKIEIDNCMGEPMDVDESGNISDDKHSVDDTEEGEISDSKDCSDHSSPKVVTSVSTMGSVWEKRYENKGGGFVTGVDIFGEKEQSKLGERAARFGLNPSEVKAISEEQLQELYKSLGVKTEDGVEEKRFRLNALHMRGTENMSTQDIFTYFKDYGPASIEWINDYACNVVWLDEISAARAILGLSKEIHGLKPSVQSKRASRKEKSDDTRSEGGMIDEDGNIDDDDVDPNDVDLVVVDQVRSKEGEIIMIIDEVLDKEGADSSKVSNAVNASDITIPIPPGLWRKGVDYPKAKCILLRFTMYSDKKLPRAERLSDYYKRHGNPNYGGIRGLITSSRKRRYQRNGQSQIFDDDLGDERDFGSVDEAEDSKNPWGNLARSWSNIDKNRGKQRTDRYYADSPPRKMTPPPSPLLDGSRHSSLLKRLGNTGSSTNLSSRFHSDGFNSDEEQDTSREEDRDWTRRSKVPRMRMYADEEQIRLERRKAVERSHSRRKGSKRERKETRSKSSVKEIRKSERRSRESVSKSSDSSKHVSRSRARSREDLRSRLGKDSRGHSGKGKSSSSSSSVSSKWSKVSQKALPSYGHVDLEVDKHFSAHMDSEEEDDSDVGYNDLRDTLRLGKKKGMTFDGEDLRSKLNFKKTLKENSARQKSPLRIEIDNDEYYRLIGSE